MKDRELAVFGLFDKRDGIVRYVGKTTYRRIYLRDITGGVHKGRVMDKRLREWLLEVGTENVGFKILVEIADLNISAASFERKQILVDLWENSPEDKKPVQSKPWTPKKKELQPATPKRMRVKAPKEPRVCLNKPGPLKPAKNIEPDSLEEEDLIGEAPDYGPKSQELLDAERLFNFLDSRYMYSQTRYGEMDENTIRTFGNRYDALKKLYKLREEYYEKSAKTD